MTGFGIYGTNIPYFLKNLEKNFKNLKAIVFYSCHLKDVHQSDLMSFPNLLGLYLYNNDIEIVENGLFDYNPNLVEIWLSSNKIVHIDANVFDNSSKLSYLQLSSNSCINKDALSQTAVKELIQQIKSQSMCQNSEYLNLELKFRTLKNSINSSSPQTFKNQLAELEAETKNSKYTGHFTPQIEALKAIKIEEPTTTTTTMKPTTVAPTTPKPCFCEATNQTTCNLKPILDEIKDLRASGQEYQEDKKLSQNETFMNIEDKIQFIEESLISFQASTAKRLETIEKDQKLSEFRLSQKIDSIARKFINMEDKMDEILEALNSNNV